MKETTKKKTKQFALIFLRTVILLFAFFLLFPPALYQYKQTKLCVIVCTLICWRYISMVVKEKKIDHLIPIMSLFAGMLILTTAINGNNVFNATWYEGIFCLSLVMLFAIGMHYDSSYFLFVFYCYCIGISLWAIFSFQEPFWLYFFGEKAGKQMIDTNPLITNANNIIVFFFPALFSGYILLKKKYLPTIISLIIYILLFALFLSVCIAYDEKGNSIVLILWGLFVLLGRWVPFEKVFRPFIVLALNIPIFVWSQLYDPKNPGFLEKIFVFFGASSTIDGRTPIWEEARASIASHPAIGIGLPETFYGTVYTGAYHAHSLFLNVLVKVGAVGFTIFSLALVEICRALRRIGDRKIKCGCILFFACFLLDLQFDVYAAEFLYGAAALVYFTSISFCTLEKKEQLYWHFEHSSRKPKEIIKRKEKERT